MCPHIPGNNKPLLAGFEVLKVAIIKNIMIWDVTHVLLEEFICFRGMYCFHLQGLSYDMQARNKKKVSSSQKCHI
jgi:hypothetical protein